MIEGVGSVAVLVRDARRSAVWYRDKLGFEIVGDEGHAVFVRPKGAVTPLIHLCAECDAWGSDRPGGRTGVWLHCGEVTIGRHPKSRSLVIPASRSDEVEKTYLELKRRGVKFSEELTSTDWGKYAVFKDPDGNEFEIS